MKSLPANIKSLAALALFSKLRDQNINVLDIVAGMVERCAWLMPMTTYFVSIISDKIHSEYGFTLPDNIIDKAMQESSLFERIHNLEYHFKRENFDASKADCSDQIDKYTELRNDFIRFAENFSGAQYSENDRKALQNSLFRYLIEDSYSDSFSPVVHKYILAINSNPKAKELIRNVTDGLLVYIGLDNECILKRASDYRITGKLVLVLDTEILYHLMGYNGSVYQKLAKEFYDIIEKYNQIYYSEKKGRKIVLRYLDISKDEINCTFDGAEKIIRNNNREAPRTEAMRYMVSNAKSASDVSILQEKFWYGLETQYRILSVNEDESAQNVGTSNEFDVVENPKDFDEQDDIKRYTQVYEHDVITFTDVEKVPDSKLLDFYQHMERLNHISRLRANRHTVRKLESAGYLLITGKNDVLRKSRKIYNDKEIKCGYWLAMSMPTFTREFWLRVNPQFKADFNLLSFDVIVRTQRIVAQDNALNVQNKYLELTKAFKEKTLSEDDIAITLAGLKKVGTRPEDIASPDDMFDASAMATRGAEIMEQNRKMAEDNAAKDETIAMFAVHNAERDNNNLQAQYNVDLKKWGDRKKIYIKGQKSKMIIFIIIWLISLAIVAAAAICGTSDKNWLIVIIIALGPLVAALFTLKSDRSFMHCMRYLCSGKYRDAVSANFEKEYIAQNPKPELQHKTPEDCIREMQQRASRQE